VGKTFAETPAVASFYQHYCSEEYILALWGVFLPESLMVPVDRLGISGKLEAGWYICSDRTILIHQLDVPSIPI
jgi:hypothetical protein